MPITYGIIYWTCLKDFVISIGISMQIIAQYVCKQVVLPEVSEWFFSDISIRTDIFPNKDWLSLIDTLKPRQNGCRFTDHTFKCIFLNGNNRISMKISLQFVTEGPTDDIPALVKIRARRQPGKKPFSEIMMVRLLMHICVTGPQWVKA